MATYKSYRDLDIWQKSISLCKDIYQIEGKLNKDFSLRDQMRRAAISIASNIAEGFERDGYKEFIRFLTISKASAEELRTQLYIANEINYINKESFQTLDDKLHIICMKIGGFIKYLRKPQKR